MTAAPGFDKIELSLIRVLHTVITERSVSRAALRLATSQPAVSGQLRKLRQLTGDPLLVRSGQGMAPTAVALQLLPVAAQVLQGAQALFGGHAAAAASFAPGQAQQRFTLAASDYLDPLFLPELVARVRAQAPGVVLEIQPLSRDFDYRAHLARGELDLVVGNWLKPPAELHLGRLLSDEIVCLVSDQHPALRNPRSWTLERYLQADHVAPAPPHAGSPGVVDEHLAAMGLQRRIVVRTPHFGLAPAMVARSNLVLTTGRLFCQRYLAGAAASSGNSSATTSATTSAATSATTSPGGPPGLRILRCPAGFPPLAYYQLWHGLTHASPPVRWLREQVREVARALPGLGVPAAAARHPKDSH